MRYLPINLDIRGRRAVVVGGGSVAERKCLALLKAGALVTVVAPTLTRTLRELSGTGGIVHLAREYKAGDLNGSFLVFAATDNGLVNKAVAEDAKYLGIMANIADSPEKCTFTLPSVISRGDLLIAVSTTGMAPALAAKIREDLESRYGPEYAELNNLLGRLREKLLTEKMNNQYNKRILRTLVEMDLAAHLKRGAYLEIDRILIDVCGAGFSLASLGIIEKDK